MARRTDGHKIEKIADYVKGHPGSRPADIARALGVPRSSITRALPALEELDQLVSEDRHGGLWPFRR
jgi:DNA-binding IclR family transcriptional regulator